MTPYLLPLPGKLGLGYYLPLDFLPNLSYNNKIALSYLWSEE